MKTSIIVLFILICPLYNHAQTIDIGIGGGENMNFSQFYNADAGQNLLLSTYSPTYGTFISYTNKKGRKIQGNVYYNKALNAVKVPRGIFMPPHIHFKMIIPFSYIQYGLSYQIPISVSKKGRTSLHLHSDVGMNFLTWNSFAKGVWDTLVYKKKGNEEVWLNYSAYTLHQYDYNFFIGGGLNLNQKLSDNFTLQANFSYKLGFKPLNTMRIEYIIHQSPQDAGVYSSGIGFSSCNSLTSRLSLIYHLHTHRREKK